MEWLEAQQLSMCLRGNAQKVLADLTLNQINNYSEIRSALMQRFNPPGREVAYRCDFRHRRRQKSETVAQYGYSLRRLATMAFPDISRDAREMYTIDQFINGLSSHEIKKHVQFAHPKSLDEAITLAIEFEAFDGPADSIKKPDDQFSVQAKKKNGFI